MLSHAKAVRLVVGLATLVALLLVQAGRSETTRAQLLAGFQESVVFSGLTNPTVVQFSPDGRVFVGEKSGLIKVFDNLSDPTPTIFADLRTNVYNFWDRGLLGLALDPNFPTNPYLYVLYTYDAAIGGVAPRWGSPGATGDPCPNPPGALIDGCVVSGRLSRLQANGNVMTGSEQVLIEDWCQQYPSHSIGTLAFGPDGALYAGGGDGASFDFADYGQAGNPLNPCGDPPAGVGGVQTPPTAEGGALRSQDLRTSSDPLGLDGTIIRVSPTTGAALPDNPGYSSPDPNVRRVVAYGTRNPFRFTIRPGTNEVWLGDVGMDTWEEINRFNVATDGVKNFGWPCYEGAGLQPDYDAANLDICENLYGESGAVAAPFYTYNHSAHVVTGETCPTGNSGTTGVAFYNGGSYPASYANALFFADYSRECIWVMFAGAGGLPDPAARAVFVPGAASPVDLKIGPGGDLFYVDLVGGTVRRISYVPDADGDGVNNVDEGPCGGDPLNPAIRPERVDGPFAGVSDDGDAQVDEALPVGSSGFDCDGDGYTGTSEAYVFASGASTARDQDACGNNGWPSDLFSSGASMNRIDLQDIGSFIAPIPRLGTSPGDGFYNIRWDLKPGPNFPFPGHISVADIGTVLTGSQGNPPMLGGTTAFGNPAPTCPWPP